MIKILDHASRAVARFITQFKDKPRLENLARILGARAQTIEDAAWDVLTLTGISSGFGAQLDGIGRVLGMPRDGRDDPTYRLWLRAKLKLDTSSGTVPEILAIFATLIGARTRRYIHEGPAAFVLRIGGASSFDDFLQLVGILRSAKAAGVRSILEWLNDAPANSFTLDTGPGLDAGIFGNAA